MKYCITGKMGSGKSTFMEIAKQTNCNTFIADDFINEMYLRGKPGFKGIVKEFGIFLSDGRKIDKKKLLEVLLEDPNNEARLVAITNKLIYKAIKKLDKNKLWFIELGIYIKYEEYFKDLFDKVILIRKEEEINYKQLSELKKHEINKNHPGLTLDDSKLKYDYLLINSGSLDKYKDDVLKFLDQSINY